MYVICEKLFKTILFQKRCATSAIMILFNPGDVDELVGGGSGIEDFADFVGEGCGSKGFGEKLGVGIENAVVDDGVFGVAGHEEHFDFGPAKRDLVGNAASAGG